MMLKFKLGRLLTTPAAKSAIELEYMIKCLRRHARGDWVGVCFEDHGWHH